MNVPRAEFAWSAGLRSVFRYKSRGVRGGEQNCLGINRKREQVISASAVGNSRHQLISDWRNSTCVIGNDKKPETFCA